MSGRGTYVARMDAVSISVAKSLVEITAPSTSSVMILRAWAAQSSSTSSAQQSVRLLRKTAAGTGTAFTPVALSINSAASGSTARTNMTAEGTLGALLIRDNFNVLNGWLYLPVPEERIIVAPSGILALEFPVAPGAATTYSAGIVWRELS